VFLLRAPRDPGDHPRGADPRRAVLVRAPALAPAALAPGRRGPPAPPPDEPRARAAAHGRDAVGVDRAAVGGRARAPLDPGGQRRGPVRGRGPGPRAVRGLPSRGARGPRAGRTRRAPDRYSHLGRGGRPRPAPPSAGMIPPRTGAEN